MRRVSRRWRLGEHSQAVEHVVVEAGDDVAAGDHLGGGEVFKGLSLGGVSPSPPPDPPLAPYGRTLTAEPHTSLPCGARRRIRRKAGQPGAKASGPLGGDLLLHSAAGAGGTSWTGSTRPAWLPPAVKYRTGQ